METYNKLNAYFKKKFGERTLKICVDGGFTCPNRDGTKGEGGCIFCNEKGSATNLKSSLDISNQVKHFLEYKKERANKFIVYFQNFTNTYDTIENLKAKYDASLIDERIVGLDIDTRADCINEEVCKLLASYKDKYQVFVELGLQTVNEESHKFINQNITNDDFIKAVELLNKYGIEIIVHIMIGLPNETKQDLNNLVRFLKKVNFHGLKIHSTYIVKGTILEELYSRGLYAPLTYNDYLDSLLFIITNISPNVVIHRITGDPSKEELVEPKWMLHKKKVLNDLDRIMKEHNLVQGKFFKK